VRQGPPRWLVLLLVGAAAQVACGPPPGPQVVRVFGQNPEGRRYELFDARLETLEDLAELRGRTVRMRGGTTIVADALVAVADPKSADVLRAEGGGPVAAAFSLRDGVYHAQDFDSLNQASAYWALERSRRVFVALGVPDEALEPLSAYYHPRFQAFTKLLPTFWLLTDNAAYAPTFDGFLIVPHLVVQGIPFSTNLGIMAHEYGHKVLHRLVERDAAVPAWRRTDWPASRANQYRGMDEGLSDYFGALASSDANFMAASLHDLPEIAAERDMRVARVLTEAQANALLSDATEDASGNPIVVDPHDLGATFAAALWELGERLGDPARLGRELVALEVQLGELLAQDPRYDFSLLGVADLLALRLTGAERDTWCELVHARFGELLRLDLTHPVAACP
jgi:hypothetical protein